MRTRLVWLGKLADVAGTGESELPADTALDWSAVLRTLPAAVAQALRDERVRVARNGALVADKTALRIEPGDEIAFLPPVSGG
jgi:molybdopterin synthase sulfur carrier subunit